MASTSMGCVMLYLPSPNGHICSVYEISSYYLHKWSFCLALKAPQPRLHLDHIFEGFLSTLPWILWLLSVCLSTFTLHSIQISGMVQPSHGCPERKVAWCFFFFSFCFFNGVCVRVWSSFLSLSSCHSCGEAYCVICEVSQIYLKATSTSEVFDLKSINSWNDSLKASKY